MSRHLCFTLRGSVLFAGDFHVLPHAGHASPRRRRRATSKMFSTPIDFLLENVARLSSRLVITRLAG
jgi:endonuclease/exonuclease/phosphatase (EEP) superfamily protein YafD